jgi:hypothetical protein
MSFDLCKESFIYIYVYNVLSILISSVRRLHVDVSSVVGTNGNIHKFNVLHFVIFYFRRKWLVVRFESTWYCGHYWPIVQAPDDRWGWLWRIWWNKDWQAKPKYSEKTCPSATFPPQIPHEQTRARTRAARGSQRLTAWAMARPRRKWLLLFFYYWWGGIGTAATSGLLYKPQMIYEGDCGAIGGIKIGRGNRSTRRKPAPAPLFPPQIPHD